VCRAHWEQLKLKPSVPNATRAAGAPKKSTEDKPQKKQGDKDASTDAKVKETTPDTKTISRTANKALYLDAVKNCVPMSARLYSDSIAEPLKSQALDVVLKSTAAEKITTLEDNKSNQVLKLLDKHIEHCLSDKASIDKANAYKEEEDGKRVAGFWPSALNPTPANLEDSKKLRETDMIADLILANREVLLEEALSEGEVEGIRNLSDRVRKAYAILHQSLSGPERLNKKKVSAAATKLSNTGLAFHKKVVKSHFCGQIPTSAWPSFSEIEGKDPEQLETIWTSLVDAYIIPAPTHSCYAKYGRADIIICLLLCPDLETLKNRCHDLHGNWSQHPDYLNRKYDKDNPRPPLHQCLQVRPAERDEENEEDLGRDEVHSI
jgi:hypothetical protein